MRDLLYRYMFLAVHHCPLPVSMDSGLTMAHMNIEKEWERTRQSSYKFSNSQMEQIRKKTRPTRATSARSATRAARAIRATRATRAIRATRTTTAIRATRVFAIRGRLGIILGCGTSPELESEMVIFGNELCDVALAGENECWCFKFF